MSGRDELAAVIKGNLNDRRYDGIVDHFAATVGVEQLLEAARNSPECFRCGEPIAEFSEVRIITVRVDGEPQSVWVHADHAKP